MITITIDTGNAAFEDPVGRNQEVARILRELSKLYEQAYSDDMNRHTLHDINGNTVGRVEDKL